MIDTLQPPHGTHTQQHHDDMVGPHRNRKRRKQLPASKRIIKSLAFCFLACYLSVLWLTGIWHVRQTIRGDPTTYAHTSTWNLLPSNSPIRIGIASTITACGKEPYTEGAAVLKYSIDLTSHLGSKGGKYDYQFYVFYHPDALECVQPLASLGFTLLERPTPVNVSDIRGSILRERISSNGCCGEKELIKLEVFRLTQHPVVIHMDLDTLVIQPMDPIIDFLLDPSNRQQAQQQVPLMWPNKPIPKDVSMVYTKDYNLVPPKRPDKPFQGGFFAIRPSHAIYHAFVELVLEGDYREGEGQASVSGWGGQVGPFHGGMTIQGLFPWYFEYLHPHQAVELNRCIYNNMADNPRTLPSINDTAQGQCRTNEKNCEDCRKRPLQDIVTFHFTVCFKPWKCPPQQQDRVEARLCHAAHHEWFRYRRAMEDSWGRTSTNTGTSTGTRTTIGMGHHLEQNNSTFLADHFLGYCSRAGYKGYKPIRAPYGMP